MGCFPKKNKVEPLGSAKTKDNSAKPTAKPKGKGCFNAFSAFITSLFFLKTTKMTKVTPFNSNLKGSMYPDSDSDDSQSSGGPATNPRPSPRRQARRRPNFEEVVFQLPGTPDSLIANLDHDESGNDNATNATTAKVSVATNALPAPNEFRLSQDQRTNQEIISEMRETGLVSSGVNEARGGISFDLRVTNVRPMAAKGKRVRKPPRRLEQLTTHPEPEQHRKVMAMRGQIKQAKAERQRMELEGSRFDKINMQSLKHQRAADALNTADEIKKQETSKKIQQKEERAKSARTSLRQARLRREEFTRKRREMARKSKQLNLGGHGSKVTDETPHRLDSPYDVIQKMQ